VDFITWNNKPGQAVGEEASELRRVATAEVLINGRTYGIEIQSKATGNNTKAFRVSTDLPEFVSNWGPTLSGAKSTAVQWAAMELQTKAQNVWNAQWWIGVAHTGKRPVATIVGGLCDTTRGRICISPAGNGWQVALVANDATWEANPTVVLGGLQAYTVDLWDAIETAAKWVAAKQAEHDAAITDAMLAVAEADAVAIATAKAEHDAAITAWLDDTTWDEAVSAVAIATAKAEQDAQWAREVDAEQKEVLARGELAIALANGDADAVHALVTRYPQFRPLAGLRVEDVTPQPEAVNVEAVAKAVVPPVKVRGDGKIAGTSGGWMPVDDGRTWVRTVNVKGTYIQMVVRFDGTYWVAKVKAGTEFICRSDLDPGYDVLQGELLMGGERFRAKTPAQAATERVMDKHRAMIKATKAA